MLSDPELDRILQAKMKQMVTEPRPGNSIVTLTTSNFDRYIDGAGPVLVDFWAEWCGPCRTMEPVIAKLSQQYSGRVTFGRLNVDEQPEIATRFDVLSIPTFMIFRSGRPLDAVIGAVGAGVLDKAIQKALGT